MLEQDCTDGAQEAIQTSYINKTGLRLVGTGSKNDLELPCRRDAKILDFSSHRGIIDYQPSELTITVRSGTTLAEIDATLDEFDQHIACEIPMLNNGGSIGGAIATGWSGPGSFFRGKLRDFVLGVKMINGKGDILNFGGKVLKNVAGFDVARLICGSYGTLGAILEITLKVSPKPRSQCSFSIALSADDAIQRMHQIAAREPSLTGACWWEGLLYLRFDDIRHQSIAKRVEDAKRLPEARSESFWRNARNYYRKLFNPTYREVWALACAKSSTPDLQLPGLNLIDQCGALRWYVPTSTLDMDIFIQELHARNVRAHLMNTNFKYSQRTRFLDIPPTLQDYYKRIKHAFDPGNVLNPGILGF